MIDFNINLIKGFTEINKIEKFQNSIYYRNKQFIMKKFFYENQEVYAIDLRKTYNKDSQMPIWFKIKKGFISKRKLKRVNEAINFLINNKKEAGTFLGQMPGFDDLSYYSIK